MIHNMKDLDDNVDSRIHFHHSHTHLLESWNKLLEIKDVFSKYSKGLSKILKIQKNSQDLTLSSTLNLNYEFKVIICGRKDIVTIKWVLDRKSWWTVKKTLYGSKSATQICILIFNHKMINLRLKYWAH